MNIVSQDQRYMQHALELAARAAELGEVPVGALVVLDDEIIGEGWNQPISGHDPTAHAEVVALRAAAQNVSNYRLPQATLYVTIEPCTMCAGAMIHARIARIVYGALEAKSGVAESNGCIFKGEHLNHQLELVGGVLAEECSAVMSDFFKRRRQQKRDARLALRS